MKYREAAFRAALEMPFRLGEMIVTIGMFLGAFSFAFWLWGKHVAQPALETFGHSLPAVIAWPLGLSPMLVGLIALTCPRPFPFDGRDDLTIVNQLTSCSYLNA